MTFDGKKMSADIDDDSHDMIIAYMLGSRDANERLKVLQGYVTRLEAAYIDMVFSATGSDKEAQDALTKIREEPTC